MMNSHEFGMKGGWMFEAFSKNTSGGTFCRIEQIELHCSSGISGRAGDKDDWTNVVTYK